MPRAAAPLSAIETLARAMPERGRGGLDEQVRAILAGLPSLLGYHTWDSRRSPEGFPDWVFCGPRGVLYRELKRQGKDPEPRQQDWLDALSAAGQDAGVWRPADLLDGTVARELAVLAGMRLAAGGDSR